MRLNAFLLASCLLAVALSGCADEPAESSEPAETDDLQSGDVALNTPPVADLRADLTNGTAPMNVTFTLEGSDDDDDNLTWTFDAGDGNTTANGTSLPAAVNATYGVGNWTATFSVSDGKNTTVTTLLVAVAEGVAAVPAEPQETIVIEGSITGAYYGVDYTASNEHEFEVTQLASMMTVSLDWGLTAIDLDYDVIAPDGSVAASQASFNEPTGNVFDVREPDSEIKDAEPGTWKVVVYPGEAVAGDYTFTITFE